MLKYIGCAVTVVSAWLWGLEKSTALKKSARLTVALCDLVKRTGEDIAVLCRPLDEIFGTYKSDALEEAGFLCVLREKGFYNAVLTVEPLISDDAAEILKPFAERLGGGDREAQTALCKRTAQRLFDLSEKEREKLTEKTKMYRALPLLCALSAVILIL